MLVASIPAYPTAPGRGSITPLTPASCFLCPKVTMGGRPVPAESLSCFVPVFPPSSSFSSFSPNQL